MSEAEERPKKIGPAKWIVVALLAGASLYQVLMNGRLGHTAAMFLGIPALLAILLVLTVNTKTVTGGILKTISVALLIVGPLMGEGYLCILMAAPLFLLVGLVVGSIIDWQIKRRKATLGCVSIILLPMCLEGVIPQLTLNRSQTVEVTRTVPASMEDVETTLSQSPRIRTKLPGFLRIGFPRPLEAHGAGLANGDTRTIHFSGAEGDPPGDLIMRVTEHRPGYVRFETISDASKLTQWVKWNGSEVRWSRIDPTHTSVTWCVWFERQLDPAWYFVPWQRLAVHEAANYLIAANATPEGPPK